jgi:hypothetical protein
VIERGDERATTRRGQALMKNIDEDHAENARFDVQSQSLRIVARELRIFLLLVERGDGYAL